MNRIDLTFERLRKEGKKAYIPYVTAGDPDMAVSEKIIRSLALSGADIIEIGIPFSDPIADGPTIQRAVTRSLSGGCTVKKVMFMARRLRKSILAPFVFMTYYNIIFNHGVEKFVKDSIANGVDGVIVPDLPLEESKELADISRKAGFSLVALAAPTTSPERFKKISSMAGGFIYYVSLTGVTGAKAAEAAEIGRKVRGLKKVTDKPVCVGFGVSGPALAREIAASADGVIVGSALIKLIEKDPDNKGRMPREIEMFSRSIAEAVHSVRK
ncbi:MAG: tryptophan synthase subunit alpha [Candidatus Omnitrophica bacterium]|nr:tryptophan synthase subunit alpha [Candidatus Omnitrophota bacterium]